MVSTKTKSVFLHANSNFRLQIIFKNYYTKKLLNHCPHCVSTQEVFPYKSTINKCTSQG